MEWFGSVLRVVDLKPSKFSGLLFAHGCELEQQFVLDHLNPRGQLQARRFIRKELENKTDCQFALWPLTVKFLKGHGNMGGAPGDRVFLSQSWQPLVHERYVDDVLKKTDCVRLAFTRLMKSLDIPQYRGFYALRKTAACEIERTDPTVTEMYLGYSERGLKRHYAERGWARLDTAIMELAKIMD